ncbi:MAG TPA: hypothetical protein VD833_17360 [Vicinamibacterales bacterium]|nr:hypothetical protein [Vicinamibacterales bacterium]
MPDVRSAAGSSPAIAPGDLDRVVAEILQATPLIDIHTHLFPPGFGALASSGIDELLTYHYLEAELFRFARVTPDAYWGLDVRARADVIWQTLFVERTPLSEAARGVVAVLDALGLDSRAPLAELRDYFRAQPPADHVRRVLQLAGVSDVVMTNDPLDPDERAVWEAGIAPMAGFHAALRLDRILNDWDAHRAPLTAAGFDVAADAGGGTTSAIRRFLSEWATRVQPAYMAVSLPDTFDYPVDDIRTRLLRDAVLPACRELRIPMALMIGVRRQVNPRLRLAGDASGMADLGAVGRLCADFPDNRFLVSVLSRENQHELCVYARKFGNLVPFGCWWFLNNPSIVEEITRERLEMLGTSFIPQHSDARILEQLIYKWRNTRRTIGPILAGAYRLLAEDGRPVTRAAIERDVRTLFRTNFENLTGTHATAAR